MPGQDLRTRSYSVPPSLKRNYGLHSTKHRRKNLIRLLHLIPGSYTDDAIKFDFSVVSLDDELQYEALSYVWGEASDTRGVELGGSPVPVTANVFSALRRLRLHDQTRIIWVDALCINQPVLQERASQVSRTDQI